MAPMRKRSSIEVSLALFAEFMHDRTQVQSELARKLELTSRTVAKYLNALAEHGVPFEVEEDDHQIVWSLPPRWIPGGVLLRERTADNLAHLLALLAPSSVRDKALEELRVGRGSAPDPRTVVVTEPAAEGAFTYLFLVEDAALARVPLRIRHVGKGPLAGVFRHVSPVRILATPPVRVVAVCHKTKALECVPLDAIVDARRDAVEPYHAPAPEALEAFLLTARSRAFTAEPASERRPDGG